MATMTIYLWGILTSLLILTIPTSAQGGPTVTVVANSIDGPLAEGYFITLNAAGIQTNQISAAEFESHRDDPVIFILGGHRAPEGVGDIISPILTESEKQELMSSWDAQRLIVLPNQWREGQLVVVFAGHSKQQTRAALYQSQSDIIRNLLFEDPGDENTISDSEAPIPSLDANQAYTEIDADQAAAIIEGGNDVVLVDVRAPVVYQRGHIPGAINVPVRDLEKTMPTLDSEKTYILYCGGNSESIYAGDYLAERGYDNLYRLVDGYVAWRREGYPRNRTLTYT